MSMIKRNFITVVSSPVKEKKKFNGRCILTPWFNPETGKPRAEYVINNRDEYIDFITNNKNTYPCEFIKERTPCKVYLDIDETYDVKDCSEWEGRDGLKHYSYRGKDKVNIREEIKKVPLFHNQDFNIISRKERKINDKVKFSYHIVFSNLYTDDNTKIKEYLLSLGYKNNEPFDLGVYGKNQGMNALFCKKPKIKEGDDDIQPLGGDEDEYDRYNPIEQYLITVVPDDATFIEWDKWIVKKGEEVKKEIKKEEKKENYVEEKDKERLVNMVKDLLELISPYKPYDLWIGYIMTIKSVLQHDESLAYDIAVEWSKETDKNFDGIWRGIRDLESYTIGTLRKSAEIENEEKYKLFKKKWDNPKYDIIDDDDDTDVNDEYDYDDELKTYEELRKEFNKNCGVIEFPLRFVNERGNFYCEGKFKCLKGDIWYADEKGKPKKFINKWLSDPRRKKYDGICFEPNEELVGNDYNMYKGFTYANMVKNNTEKNKLYDEVDITPYLNHIKEVICSGNEDEYKFIIKWMAKLVKYPWKKTGVVILLKGIEGIGKNLFSDTYGDLLVYNENRTKCKYTMITSKPDRDVFGRFCINLQKRLLVILQEANRLHKYHDELKDNITGYDFVLEKKGEDDDVERKNYLNFMITTNNYNSALITPTDRRFFIPTIDNKKRDTSYYQNIVMTTTKKGFNPSLMKFLLDYEVDENENLQDTRPITSGFIEMKRANYTSIEMFLLDKKFYEKVKYNTKGEYIVFTSKIFSDYKFFCSVNNYDKTQVHKRHFEQHLTQLGFDIRISKKQLAVAFSKEKYERFYKDGIEGIVEEKEDIEEEIEEEEED